MPSRTVFEILQDTVTAHGSKLALSQPTNSEGARGHKTWTWNEHLKTVQEIALGLDAIGVRKGDVVALCSETRAEFYLADVAIMSMGAIAAALYQSYPAKDLLKTDRGIVARASCSSKIRRCWSSCAPPRWTRFILMTGAAEGAVSLADLQAEGRAAMEGDREPFRRSDRGRSPRAITPSSI